MIYANDVPSKARKAYSSISLLFDVLAGRIEADEHKTKIFSGLDYPSILNRFRQIFTETLLLTPSPQENAQNRYFLNTAKFAYVYALTPTILQQLGFQHTTDVGTIITNELETLVALKDVLRQRFQKEEIAYILAHCCDKRGFDILLEHIDIRSIAFAVEFLDGSATVGMSTVQKNALYRINITPMLFTLNPWQRFSLMEQHFERVISFVSTNSELKKLLLNVDALSNLTRSGPNYYLDDGSSREAKTRGFLGNLLSKTGQKTTQIATSKSLYQSSIENIFKVLLMCGTSEALDVFFELTELPVSFFIDGTYPEHSSRFLINGLRKDCMLDLSNPLNTNYYNQLYSARVESFSAKHVMDGIRNKHPVLRWLTLKALKNTSLPQGVSRDEILNFASNDTSEMVKELAVEMRKTA